MSRRDLRRQLGAGHFQTKDVFWFKGLEGWTKITDAPDLFRDLDAGPAAASAPSEAVESEGGAEEASEPQEAEPETAAEAKPQAEPEAAAEPEAEAEPETVAEPEAEAEPEPVEAAESEPAATEACSPQSEDARLDSVFSSLVEASWDYLKEHELAGHIDEVFLGAVITSALERGYSLIDLESDGSHHYLRFEDLDDQSRVIFRLRHLTSDLAKAKVLGQRASAVIGYGEKARNITKVMSALKAELKSGFIQNPEPGTITVDGDITSGYVYAQVDLYLKIDEYVSPDYEIDYDRLADHVTATTHALRKYVRGRFA